MLLWLVWLLTLTWLAICVLTQWYFGWLYIKDVVSLLRDEALIGLSIATLYAMPAAVLLALLQWRFRDKPLPRVRYAGNSLLAVLLIVFMVFLVFT